jgi:hypothetical protein
MMEKFSGASILKVFNKLPFVTAIKDRFDDLKASREIRRLREFYAPKVAEAEKAKDWNERGSVLSEWQFESEQVSHPVYARKAERITATARKYGITVPRKPTGYDEESDDWELSNTTGDWLLSDKLEERLRRDIRTERRSSYDEFRKWATVVFALLGFALGFYSLRLKQKQPDPCPRNYYRSDTGECIFALQQAPSKPLPKSAP